MKSSSLPFLISVFWLRLWASPLEAAQAVPPQVANVHISELPGTMLIEIGYDLIDPDSEQVWVDIQLSIDGGTTYKHIGESPFISITGDTGTIVAPGRNRRIVWDAWHDGVDNFTTLGRARITVVDVKVCTFPPPFPAPMPNLVWIPPGTFTMGSPENEKDRGSDKGPQVRVVLSRGFFLGKYEMTQREYQDLIGSNPSYFPSNLERPVEMVSWDDAMNYCRKLTERERSAGRLPAGYEYRLPTEAQWEYACRAGTATRFSFGDDLGYGELVKYAWHSRNSESTTHPVGTRLPNSWGLHDMHGNVWEWCWDWYANYPGGSVTDPEGPATGSNRVLRGGGWFSFGQLCRSAYRGRVGPFIRDTDFGFRVALVPKTSRLAVLR